MPIQLYWEARFLLRNQIKLSLILFKRLFPCLQQKCSIALIVMQMNTNNFYWNNKHFTFNLELFRIQIMSQSRKTINTPDSLCCKFYRNHKRIGLCNGISWGRNWDLNLNYTWNAMKFGRHRTNLFRKRRGKYEANKKNDNYYFPFFLLISWFFFFGLNWIKDWRSRRCFAPNSNNTN